MTPHEALEEPKIMTTCRCHEAFKDRGLHDPDCQCDYAGEVQALTDYVAKLEARTPSVIPPVWVRMLDPVGHPTDLHHAWCPLFERHFWAEREDMIPQIEARRAARIMKVIHEAENV